MAVFQKPDPKIWTGRKSNQELYLHEKVSYSSLDTITANSIAIFGYACDDGVKRNHGRIGAKDGPGAVRTQLAKMPNHLDAKLKLVDCGNITCEDSDMEDAQNLLTEKVAQLLKKNAFPILIGGGHDIAYGHYNGIKSSLAPEETVGIINFDAHFDLRSNAKGNNSGTPFYQIAQDCQANNSPFNYLCLGIRRDANDSRLFGTAQDLGVDYIENKEFSMDHAALIVRKLLDFIQRVDHIYLTIDLDGFSSAYAPGVSAPSPMGFSPKIVLESMVLILKSKKLIAMDIAEMNPKFDVDNQTAKLAASLIHFVLHNLY